MACSFSGNSYLRSTLTNATLSAYPLTIACWFRPASIGTNQVIMATQEVSASSHRHTLAISTTANNNISVTTVGSSATNTFSINTSLSINTWYHICCVFTSSTSRNAYLSGGLSGSSSVDTGSLNNQTDISIGARYSSPSFGVFLANGTAVAEAAVWNVSLSTDDIAQLQKAASPMIIRPQSLVFCSPLIRDIIETRKFSISSINTVTPFDHPRIYL